MHNLIEGIRLKQNSGVGLTRRPGKQRVLLVDDDDTIRHMLTYGLQTFGYEVRQAKNGAEGFDLLEEYDPDIIVLDLYMPEMDGLAFLKRYQGPVPVLVCSGSDEEQDIQRTLEKGAARYLQKPVSLDALHEAIGALI